MGAWGHNRGSLDAARSSGVSGPFRRTLAEGETGRKEEGRRDGRSLPLSAVPFHSIPVHLVPFHSISFLGREKEREREGRVRDRLVEFGCGEVKGLREGSANGRVSLPVRSTTRATEDLMYTLFVTRIRDRISRSVTRIYILLSTPPPPLRISRVLRTKEPELQRCRNFIEKKAQLAFTIRDQLILSFT